jgi:hypothetical protein
MQYLNLCTIAITLTFITSSTFVKWNSDVGVSKQDEDEILNSLLYSYDFKTHEDLLIKTTINSTSNNFYLVGLTHTNTIVPDKGWNYTFNPNETSITMHEVYSSIPYTFQFSFKYNYTNATTHTSSYGNGTIDVALLNLNITRQYVEQPDGNITQFFTLVSNSQMKTMSFDNQTSEDIRYNITTELQKSSVIEPLVTDIKYCLETDGTKHLNDLSSSQFNVALTGYTNPITVDAKLGLLPVLSNTSISYIYNATYYDGTKQILTSEDNNTPYLQYTRDQGLTQLYIHNKLFFDLLNTRIGSFIIITKEDALPYGLPFSLTINSLGKFWPSIYDTKSRSDELVFNTTLADSYYTTETDEGFLKFNLTISDKTDNSSLITIYFDYQVNWHNTNSTDGVNFITSESDIELADVYLDDSVVGFDLDNFRSVLDNTVRTIFRKKGEYSLFKDFEKLGILNAQIDKTYTPKAGFILGSLLDHSEQKEVTHESIKFLE